MFSPHEEDVVVSSYNTLLATTILRVFYFAHDFILPCLGRKGLPFPCRQRYLGIYWDPFPGGSDSKESVLYNYIDATVINKIKKLLQAVTEFISFTIMCFLN